MCIGTKKYPPHICHAVHTYCWPLEDITENKGRRSQIRFFKLSVGLIRWVSYGNNSLLLSNLLHVLIIKTLTCSRNNPNSPLVKVQHNWYDLRRCAKQTATIPLLKTYCPHKSKAPVWVNFTRACWRLLSSFLLFTFFYFNLLFSSLFCNFVDLQKTVWVVHMQTSVLLLTLKFLNRRQQQAFIILPFLCLVITSNILSVYKRNLSSFIDKCGNALCT